jgi:uncharacterized membrane protein YbhN (UPF0104 family)
VTDADEAPRRHLTSHWFNVIVLVVGAVALAWMMHSLGWQKAGEVFREAKGWFWLIVVFDLAALACDASAVHAFMRPEARMVSWWRVAGALASGRAINLLTPGGALGEATKISMLASHAPRDRVISSIVLADLTNFYVAVAVMMIGVPITLALVHLPRKLTIAIWVALAILLVLVVAIGVVIHRGAVRTGLQFLPKKRRKVLQGKLAEIDKHLRELHHNGAPGTRAGKLWVVASRLCAWASLTTLLHAIDVSLTPTLLVGAFSVGVLVGWISSIVPLGLGVADGANYFLYDALGASGAHGVFVTLLSRARSIVIALLGLSVMAATHAVNRIQLAKRRRRFAELTRRFDRPKDPSGSAV